MKISCRNSAGQVKRRGGRVSLHQMQKPVCSSHSVMRQGPPPFAPCVVPQCPAPFIFFSRLCPGDVCRYLAGRYCFFFDRIMQRATTLFSRTITSPFSHTAKRSSPPPSGNHDHLFVSTLRTGSFICQNK